MGKFSYLLCGFGCDVVHVFTLPFLPLLLIASIPVTKGP